MLLDDPGAPSGDGDKRPRLLLDLDGLGVAANGNAPARGGVPGGEVAAVLLGLGLGLSVLLLAIMLKSLLCFDAALMGE